MYITLALVAANALTASDLSPSGFYVSGISQGMTTAEYNAMISNGGFRSEPVAPDTFMARMKDETVFVSFCDGKVFRAIAEYKSSDWMQSLLTLEGIGYKWGAPIVSADQNELRSSRLAFTATMPKGYRYFVAPMIKGSVFQGREMGSFQLMFQDSNSRCG
jgi:hypothetical protein